MSSSRHALANLCAVRSARRQQLVRLRQLHTAVFKDLRFRRLVAQSAGAGDTHPLMVRAVSSNRALINRLRRPASCAPVERLNGAHAAVRRAVEVVTSRLQSEVCAERQAACALSESAFEFDFSAHSRIETMPPAVGLLADFDIEIIPCRPGAPSFVPTLVRFSDFQINVGARTAPEIALS